jgi:membrane fusion protein, heavy metal efflux system
MPDSGSILWSDGTVPWGSPIVDKDTHKVHVVAEINNRGGVWRTGSFVSAVIVIERQSVPIAVPVGAIQTMDGRPVAFVRTAVNAKLR